MAGQLAVKHHQIDLTNTLSKLTNLPITRALFDLVDNIHAERVTKKRRHLRRSRHFYGHPVALKFTRHKGEHHRIAPFRIPADKKDAPGMRNRVDFRPWHIMPPTAIALTNTIPACPGLVEQVTHKLP